MTEEENSVNISKKKLFWAGIIISLIKPPLPGIIYGVALLTEKKLRREAIIVLAWTLVWTVLAFFILLWSVKQGYLRSNLPATISKTEKSETVLKMKASTTTSTLRQTQIP